MALFNWNHSFSVGLEEIDNQHQKLISIVNQLETAVDEGKERQHLTSILKDLSDYTSYHFRDEEALMKRHDYPDLQSHHEEHEDLLSKVTTFRQEFLLNQLDVVLMLEYLKEWIVNHMLSVDKKMGEYLITKGVK